MGFCRLIEHAVVTVLVLAAGTVDEAIAKHVVIDAVVAALSVRRGTREPLHAIRGGWTLYLGHVVLAVGPVRPGHGPGVLVVRRLDVEPVTVQLHGGILVRGRLLIGSLVLLPRSLPVVLRRAVQTVQGGRAVIVLLGGGTGY